MRRQFANGDGENTYVFKKTYGTAEKKRVTDIKKLAGTWYSIDFCCDYSEDSAYDPRCVSGVSDSLYLESITVKGNKAECTFNDSDESYPGGIVNKSTIGGTKYTAFELDGEMYMFYDWDGSFYVLMKY